MLDVIQTGKEYHAEPSTADHSIIDQPLCSEAIFSDIFKVVCFCYHFKEQNFSFHFISFGSNSIE